MNIQQVKELLQRYQTGDCIAEEKELIETWYQQLRETGEWQWGEDEKELMKRVIEQRIRKQPATPYRNKVFYLKHRYQWWAAASIILLLGTFSYFLFFHNTTKPELIAKVVSNDVKAPQSNKAMIILSNGHKVFLDSVGSGALAIQGNIKLVKLAGGKIAYQQGSGDINTKMEYNTLLNPRGSKVINMTLADGSKVWLNAASSVTYPVSFIGNERKVSVTGEAYFEVAHDASRPFVVSKGAMNVSVLGTHFNVNAFEDDGHDIKVSLLEGSVKINNGNAASLLKPRQQAVVSNEIKIKKDVDLEQVMAWKNGFFRFDKASLQNVLREVSRWYDVDVVYEGNNQSREFVGAIQRDLNLSEMLKILKVNKVHFKIEGKELRIMPD